MCNVWPCPHMNDIHYKFSHTCHRFALLMIMQIYSFLIHLEESGLESQNVLQDISLWVLSRMSFQVGPGRPY